MTLSVKGPGQSLVLGPQKKDKTILKYAHKLQIKTRMKK